MRKTFSLLAVGAVVLGLTLTGAASANAAIRPVVHPAQCEGTGTISYTAKNTSSKFVKASGAGSSATGTTGVQLTISKTRTFTVSGSLTVEAGADVSFSPAGVGVAIHSSVGVTTGLSFSGETSVSGAWTVPKSYKVGELEVGSSVYTGTATKWVRTATCAPKSLGTAVYHFPKQQFAFVTKKIS
jgi:hypothetical protein